MRHTTKRATGAREIEVENRRRRGVNFLYRRGDDLLRRRRLCRRGKLAGKSSLRRQNGKLLLGEFSMMKKGAREIAWGSTLAIRRESVCEWTLRRGLQKEGIKVPNGENILARPLERPGLF